MRKLKELLYIVLCVIAFSSAVANSSFSHFLNFSLPADTVRRAKAQPVLQVEDETIPDSLLHPRWKVQKTAPIALAREH